MDNNYRQVLISPETGQKHVVGSAAEAARLKARGFYEPEPELPAGEPEQASGELDFDTEVDRFDAENPVSFEA